MAQEKNQKIILFLSRLYEANRNNPPEPYDCPKGEPVYGLQTNEAPVQYLLRENPNVSEILCLMTPLAEKTAWNQFHGTIQKFLEGANRQVTFTPISLKDDTPIQEILPDILEQTNAGDKILMETTGGFRNAMMYLLLISRALSYKEVETTCAVYSNFQAKKVEDVTDMLQVFDLIDGMQNLTSFGNVAALRRYYEKREHSDKIDDLLNAVDELWGCITLCRSNQVPDKLKAFNNALKGAAVCGDPLLEALLPAFRDKFGDEMTMPDLIGWCAESDMLQQALTLYRERIPAYIMNERTDILAVKPNVQPLNMTQRKYKEHGTEMEARFHEQFLKMGFDYYKSENKEAEYSTEKKQGGDYLITLKCFEQALSKSNIFSSSCTVKQLRTITMDYLYIRALRNMANHAKDKTQENQRALNEYLEKEGNYILPKKTNAADVKNAILNALDYLKLQPHEA